MSWRCSNTRNRIAVLVKVASTTTHLVWRPGKSTTNSASADTDDCIIWDARLHHSYMFVYLPCVPKCHEIVSELPYIVFVVSMPFDSAAAW